MAEHLVGTVTEELFREVEKALESLCNEEQDRIVVFRMTKLRHVIHNVVSWK